MAVRGQDNRSRSLVRSTMWTGVILGIGIMGAVDTIIFHQLLQWHNFYTDTTEYWRIFSDGLLHSFTAAMLFLGALRLWSQRQEISLVVSSRPFWTGILFGAGGFQLFDGIVNHKILRLHQIREGVDNLLPYDIAWNAAAILMLVIGWLLWRGVRDTDVVETANTSEAGARHRRTA